MGNHFPCVADERCQPREEENRITSLTSKLESLPPANFIGVIEVQGQLAEFIDDERFALKLVQEVVVIFLFLELFSDV
jgi:hypothetical protein